MKKDDMVNYTIAGEELFLLPEKAIFWLRKKSLFIADLHLGKSGHFRKAGIPVSSLVHHDDLNRLSAILAAWPVETIYLMGDLFHSFHNQEWKDFIDWRMQYPQVIMHLIRGNHDILDDQFIHDGNIVLHDDSFIVEPFFLSHKPVESFSTHYYQFYGHIHPGVRLNGKGLQSLSFPCFCFGSNAGVLPAFGAFTGHSVLKPSGGDAVFIVYNNLVKQIHHSHKL